MEQSLGDFDDLNFDDFNLDFDTEEHVNYLDVNAICLQTTSKKRFTFDINKQVKQIEKLIDRLPNENETFTLLAVNLDFHQLQ
nr:MAG TPA: Subunit 21 of Mediator complex [Caudoviricetes sp.]